MLPNSNALSVKPVVGTFLYPRNILRATPSLGLTDNHYGGTAIGNPSLGIKFQLWTIRSDGTNIYLSAPNTPEYLFLAGANAAWVALAFDQNAQIFVAYATAAGVASFYWFDSAINQYTTTVLSGLITRVFATLDDNRPQEATSADIILSYARLGELYFRQQRDRYGIEYDLGVAPSPIVQLGMSNVNRLQWAFEAAASAGGALVPPTEYYPTVTNQGGPWNY